ncbi:MAG: filamentous hemagglutinin N-terminal domain-containing protein [Okeania sp. SIO2G4]|uniref:two-partner secretion domain-containing protein n=1 Tax=Okeania sp. SIO2G4 TaxID=2607793 RepID=UPI0013CCB418|nr:filamentous hemagglutinin N-terminal domain-containing protein [Okeania sp. SIO2G4]NEQ90041.1 filamentous hemagglutinin N-terminal domain-containing protein [Okeania sp. SIO2G4]
MPNFDNFQIYIIYYLTYLIGFWSFYISRASAQLIPDRTLGKENSVVTPNTNIKGIESDRIDGGAKRGANLFHSFQEFNIQRGRGVYFRNPDGVANILTRITGSNTSNILGILGVLGNANLFFINPNGIIFGPEAQLDIGGSFYGATADSILFKNGFEFATSDPQVPPLLTVNLPIGLRLPENPGSIQVQGQGHNLTFDPDTFSYVRENRNIGLQVGVGETLALIGGDISLEGGNLTAEGGHIQLGSVQSGVVEVTNSSTLNYGEISVFRNIQLSQASSIDVSGAGAGDTQIQGRVIKVRDGSIILGKTLESEDGSTSIIRASDSIEVEGTTPDGQIISGIVAEVAPGATGRGGNLIVQTKSLLLRELGEIRTTTLGQGNGGDLTISATDVELIGTFADQFGRVTALNTFVEILGEGDGGNLRLQTKKLRVRDGAQIAVNTFGKGNGGDLIISADHVEIIGMSPDDESISGLFNGTVAFTETTELGNGGNLILQTKSLRVQDGAQINTSTGSQGNAGDLIISATDIELIGTSENNEFPSGLFARVRDEVAGNGGNVRLQTKNLRVQDGAQIATGTRGEGNAGNITISAQDIELIGTFANEEFPSGLIATVQEGALGNGGSITVNTKKLRLQDGAQINARSRGGGDAGNITISTKNTEIIGKSPNGIWLSGLTAEATDEGTGRGGTLTIHTRLANGKLDWSSLQCNWTTN